MTTNYDFTKFLALVPENTDPKEYLRPKTLSEMAMTSPAITELASAILMKRVPHFMIFYGSPGSGKTSISKLLPAEMCKAYSIASFNAAREINGASLVKDETSKLVQDIMIAINGYTMSKGPKFFIINEAHKMTRDSQQLMKDIIEKACAEGNIYILFSLDENYQDCIHPAIISRAKGAIYQFSPLTQNNGIAFVRNLIGSEEESHLSDDAIIRHILEPANYLPRDIIGEINYLALGGEAKTVIGVSDITDKSVRDFVDLVGALLSMGLWKELEKSDVINYYRSIFNKYKIDSLYQMILNKLINDNRGYTDYWSVVTSVKEYCKQQLQSNITSFFKFKLYSIIHSCFSKPINTGPTDHLLKACSEVINAVQREIDERNQFQRIAEMSKVLKSHSETTLV